MNYQVKNIYGKIENKSVSVSVPGSKSITARALLIAAVAKGESTLHGVQFSDDCATFLTCLKDLGIDCRVDGNTVKIVGCGGKLRNRQAEIDVGSAGTAARFLPAFLAFQNGEYRLNCSDQMKRRPISPLIDTLKSLGAQFTFLERENSYPFVIKGTVSPKTVKMTESMMRSFGVNVCVNDGTYTVGGEYSAREYAIEPDISAACYFYAMNKILGTQITVDGVIGDSLQGDIKFINALSAFNGGKIDMHEFSDQTITLAAIAPYLDNPTDICGVAHIRKQECDRIFAIASNLTAMGVRCEETADGVIIYPSQPKPAKINTFGDHRVAMGFALTGLRADGILIENAEVCSKTFKNYFEVLELICRQITK